MVNISLIQFSVDGRGCVSSLLFDPRPDYGEGNEDNGNLLQKVPCTHHCTQCPWSCSRPPLTHASAGDSWTLTGKFGSLSWGGGSLLLSPGSLCKVLFVPSKSLFPQSCASFGSSMVRLAVTSFKRAYATPRSAVPRAPAPAAGHCWPLPPQETLKHSKAGLAQFLWGLLVCTRFCLSPLSVSGGYGVSFQTWFCPSYHLARASPLPFDIGYLFLVGSNILLLKIVQQLVVILEFLQEMLSVKQVVSYKIKCVCILIWFRNFTPIYVRETKTWSYKDLYTNVQRSLIPNSSKVNQQMCVSG